MGNRALKILAGLILAMSCFGQGYIQTPPPYWYVVAPPGPLASRPAACTANFHVYICNGAGCTTNGEYHYCTALNTWTVASGADDFVLGRAALPTVGAIPRVASAGTLGESGLLDDGTQVYDASARNFGFGTTALLPPIGKSQTVISTTRPFIVGGATVASYTAVTSPTANKNYLVKTGAGTASTVGDLIVITGGTGVYTGMYSVAAIVGADTIQLNRVCHASGSDVTDIAFSQSTAPRLAVGTNRSYHSALLSNATGNEVAFRYDYTTNKATSGNDTGLQINMTDTASPGTSRTFEVNVGGAVRFYIDNGGFVTAANYNDISNIAGFGSGYSGFAVSSSYGYRFASGSSPGGTVDLALSRKAKGVAEFTSGVAGQPGGINAGSLAMQSLATPVITSVTPSANNGVTCTYTLTGYLADGVTASAPSTAVSTAVGPTGCNSNTIVWTAATAPSFYQLARTVGGTTQGIITAMGGATATWANNTTNCPAGVCTYVDAGSAASGTAPTVNSTGSILWATDGGGSIGSVTANRPANIYITGTVGTQYLQFYLGATLSTYLYSGAAGKLYLIGTAPVGIKFGAGTNSFSELSAGTINGFAIQSAAGTTTWNDAVTAASGTVAQRKIFFIDGPVLTATNASVTYTNTATMHLGVPTASTNITFTNPALSLLLDGGIRAASYLSSDGTAGVTVTTCTGYKNGLCISGT